MNEKGILTQGKVIPTLLLFTLPIFGAILLQTIYGLVDMIVVGQFADAAALSAVSVSSLVFATITSLAIGLANGGTIVIGQQLGCGDLEKARKYASTMFFLYFLIGIVLSVLFFFMAKPILIMMNTPDEAINQAVSYLRICCGGLTFIFLYNAVSSVLRADGDSKHPLLFVVVACIFNILGDLLFVAVFHMGASGAAIATILGQIMSFLFGAFYLYRNGKIFNFHRSSFRIYSDCVGELLRVGIPSALQETLVMISFIILEAIINKMGLIASAAAGITDKLFTIGVLPCTAFSASISAMVAQNMGAGKQDRVRQSLFIGLIISFVIGSLVALWLHFFPVSALRIFTQDSDVIHVGCLYLTWYVLEYPLCSLAFPLNGFINGCGHTRFTLFVNLFSTFIIRLPLVFLFCKFIPNASLLHVGLALPFATFSALHGNLGDGRVK